MFVAIIILEFHLIEIMLTNVSRLKPFLSMMFYFWKMTPLIEDKRKYFYDLE